jgi:hypothetical protein
VGVGGLPPPAIFWLALRAKGRRGAITESVAATHGMLSG